MQPTDRSPRRRRAPKRQLMLALLLGILATATQAASASGARADSGEIADAEFYFDADPALGIEAVSSRDLDARFSPAGGRRLWVGREAPVAWLRFAIGGRGGAEEGTRIVEIRPSFSIVLDRVELFIPLRDGGFERSTAGALVPSRPGELRWRSFLFPLPPGALEGGRCYVRAESSIDVEFRAYVRGEAELLRRSVLEGLVYGIVFGALAAMALYNFFLFASLRDTAYLFYVLYMLIGGAWLFWVQGWARALLGGHPGLDRSLLWLFAGLMLSCGSLFAISFLKLRGAKPALSALLAVFACIGGGAAAAGAAGLDRLAFLATNWLGAALCVSLVAAASLRLAQGFTPARYFLIAWSVLAISGIAFVLMNLKVLPVSFATSNSMALGMTAESILLSMALADRVRSLERDKLRLERSQERLREISLADALTGLYNRRFLHERLASSAANAEAEGQRLSLILLDIDGFKAINDSLGHSFGDEILVRLAKVIRSSIRDADSPCRFGGEEFVVIMPGIALDDAASVAERIRARFAADSPLPGGGEGARATVSLGVAELREGDSPQSLLDRADAAMYDAKRLGKDRVVAAC